MNLKPQSSVFKWATIGAVVAGALLAAGAANARGSWSVQIGTPGYVAGGYPAPYYAPPPVYSYPAPIYYEPPPPSPAVTNTMSAPVSTSSISSA